MNSYEEKQTFALRKPERSDEVNALNHSEYRPNVENVENGPISGTSVSISRPIAPYTVIRGLVESKAMQAHQNVNLFADSFAEVECSLNRFRDELFELRHPKNAPHSEKTRLLKLAHYLDTEILDLRGQKDLSVSNEKLEKLPFGWLVIVKGAGFGKSVELTSRSTPIGREDSLGSRLVFEDSYIARKSHVTIWNDEDVTGKSYVIPNKRHTAFLNGSILMSKHELKDRDLITVGETTLCFVRLGLKPEFWLGLVP